MLGWHLLTSRISVYRRSAELYAGTALQTVSLTLQPIRDSLVQLTVSGGASNTGEATISGSLNGITQSDRLVFDGTLPTKVTKKLYDALTGVTSSGFTNESPVPSFNLQVTGADGSPQAIPYLLLADWPAALPPQRTTWPANSGGGRTEVDNREAIVPWSDVWHPRPGDVFQDDLGLSWQVQRAPRLAGTWVAQFWLVSLVRYEPP